MHQIGRMSVPNLRAKWLHTLFKQCVVYIAMNILEGTTPQKNAGAIEGLQKIGAAIHNCSCCTALAFLLDLKMSVIKGACRM